jgi:hypothetical protein
MTVGNAIYAPMAFVLIWLSPHDRLALDRLRRGTPGD